MVYRKFPILIFSLFALFSLKISAQQFYDSIPPAGRSTIFNDSFGNNSNNWLTDNSWISGKFINGYYDILCKNFKQNTGLTYKAINVDRSKDFELETSFSIIKGTGALVFGLSKDLEHYRIEIDGKTLEIIKDIPSKNKVEKIFSKKEESIIKDNGQYNKLTIRKYRGSYYIFVNELLVKQFKDLVFSGEGIGYSVGLNSEISVDYLNVSYLPDNILPTLAEKVVIKDSIARNSNFGDPVITWTSPSAEKTPYELYSARVKASISSESELISVVFYVNGAPKGEAERQLISGEQHSYLIEKTIDLNPGENSVYFIATNQRGSKRSEDRYFINPEATTPVISWANPIQSNVIVSNDMLSIEACINSPSGLKSIKVIVNGESQGEDNLFQISTENNCNVRWHRPIILKEGVDNSVYIIASNTAGFTTSENRVIRYSRAITEKRIALIIGNSNYGTKTPLKNPVQDANLMEGTLKQLGFTVLKYTDLDLVKMKAAIRDFSQKMKEFNVALFYFAGHGVQVDGQNFLIPVDAKLESKDDCKWEAFAINDLMEEFEKNPKNINIAIFDACRSNPFQAWARGNSSGFIPLSNTSGTFVSFATAPGSTAADGSSGNGLFTEELVKQMNVPQPISSVFMNTRINVWERSKQTQRPQEWNDLNGEFYFKK